jgi:hypothetical protein
MQCALAERAGIDLAGIDPRLDQLRNRTDVQRLAAALDTELASVEAPGGQVPNAARSNVDTSAGEEPPATN